MLNIQQLVETYQQELDKAYLKEYELVRQLEIEKKISEQKQSAYEAAKENYGMLQKESSSALESSLKLKIYLECAVRISIDPHL